MTISTKANQILTRPTDYKNSDAFLERMKWDNGNKSAMFFFTHSRTIGSGENSRKEYTEFGVRFYAENANFLAELLNHKAEAKAQNKKYPLLINMELQLKSWKRPTGKMVGQNNDVPETTNVTYFQGKEPKMMDLKTYTVITDTISYFQPETVPA